MVDEKLEQQIKEINEKLRARDEAEAKKIEQEWRKATEQDTAGHTFKIFQLQQAQIANLQAQIDTSNPLAPVLRGIADLNARLAAIERIVFKKEAKSE